MHQEDVVGQERDEQNVDAIGVVQMVSIDRIEIKNRFRVPYAEDKFQSLKESIREQGIREAIRLCKFGKRYLCIDGIVRIDCSKELGLTEVPAIISEYNGLYATIIDRLDLNVIRRRIAPAHAAYAAWIFIRVNKTRKGRRTDLELSPTTGKVDTWKQSTKRYGTSDKSITLMDRVIHERPDLLEGLLLEKISMNSARIILYGEKDQDASSDEGSHATIEPEPKPKNVQEFQYGILNDCLDLDPLGIRCSIETGADAHLLWQTLIRGLKELMPGFTRLFSRMYDMTPQLEQMYDEEKTDIACALYEILYEFMSCFQIFAEGVIPEFQKSELNKGA